MISEVKRIDMPSNDVFEKEYMHKLEPVVIKNFFKNCPIAEINTKEQVLRALGNMQIGVQEEYGTAYKKNSGTRTPGNKEGDELWTVSAYFNYIEKHANTKKMCIEFPSPQELAETFSVPSICQHRGTESERFVNQCFIGNKGNYAHIHLDKGGTHGFLYQVFGRKRFITWPQSAAHKLAPFAQIGGWNLENFTDRDREDFLRFTGGKEIILEAGECVYVPSLSWHYVDYIEDSMSISLRFRRSNYVTRLVNILFPDMYLQGIAYKFADPKVAAANLESLEALEAIWAEDIVDGREKVQKIREKAKEIYNQFYPDAPKGDYYLDVEKHFPPLLPEYLDAYDVRRPKHC